MAHRYRPSQQRLSQSNMLVAGAVNAVWLAGFLRNPTRESDDRTIFYIQQSNNAEKALPVILPRNKRLKGAFRDKSAVKVVGHIMGTQQGTQRSAYIRALSVERPTQLEMPAGIAWMDHLQTGDTFKPFMDGQKLSGSSNSVRVAGFVSSIVKQPAKANGNGHAGTAKPKHLWLLVKQVEDDTAAIPVRINRYANVYAARLKLGQPVLIEGVIKGDVHGGVFIETPHVLQAEPGDIPYPPEWAKRMIREFIELTQRADVQAQQAADPDGESPHHQAQSRRHLANASDL